jgi:hypothetical protein
VRRIVVALLAALVAGADAPPADTGDFAAVEKTLAKDKSPAGLAGLARLRLYQERRAEAVKLARRALKADAHNEMAQRVLDTVKLREGRPWHIKLPKTGAAIAFAMTDPLPVVSVRAAGHDALFFIDTGAPDLILDKDFAGEIGVAGTASRATLGTFDIGAVHVDNLPVTLLGVRDITLKKGTRLDGIVGTGFLMHFLATLDYPKGELRLLPRASSKAFERGARKRGASIVPMWLVGDHFVFARARLGSGPEALFNVDTGIAGAGVQATKAALDAASVAVDDAPAPREQTISGGIRRTQRFTTDATLGTITVQGVSGIYTPDGDQYGIFPFKVAGSLSHGVFRHRALTLDFTAMKLVVE